MVPQAVVGGKIERNGLGLIVTEFVHAILGYQETVGGARRWISLGSRYGVGGGVLEEVYVVGTDNETQCCH